MIDSKPTGSQVSFINRLLEASPERDEAFQKLIREMGKSGVNDLTMQGAPELIDALKKIRVENGKSGSSYLTGKQLSYLQNLVRHPGRGEVSEKYLLKHGKEGLNFLAMDEASELIDVLRNVKMEGAGNNSEAPATRKQIQFIKNLQVSGKQLGITSEYLAKLKKVTIDELTGKEASGLVDRLKGA